jgi:hypothetical protein
MGGHWHTRRRERSTADSPPPSFAAGACGAQVASLRRAGGVMLLLAVVTGIALLTSACSFDPAGAFSGLTHAQSTPLPVTYTDASLGFTLRLPAGWTAKAQPSLHSTGRATTIKLRDPRHAADTAEVAVSRGAQSIQAFSRLGTPTTRIGDYPAFKEDIPAPPASSSDPTPTGDVSNAATAPNGQGPCLVRILLAHLDYVVAQECGADTPARGAEFEAILATYIPGHSAAGASGRAHVLAATAAVQPQTCAEVAAEATSQPADTSNWGKELASATDPHWGPSFTPGASVCSNFTYRNGRPIEYPGYWFQCTELVNRFIGEQWGHGGIDGNAATYFDYADVTGQHLGTARFYPDTQLSEDASQGPSAFKPGPGDILVWQDVQDGVNWTSGLRRSPGHVAIITATDATHVYFMQQNYSDRLYYLSLPLAQVANGWQITDHVSGVAGRIVRGWIHLTENGGQAQSSGGTPPGPPAAVANTQDVFAIGADGELYNYHWEQGGAWTSALNVRTTIAATTPAVKLIGAPSMTTYTLGANTAQSAFVADSEGHLYEYSHNASDGWAREELTALAPLPTGVTVAAAPRAVTYAGLSDNLVHHVVYVSGSDGQLYRYAWTQGGTWTQTAVGDLPAAPLTGGPSVITWTQAATRYEALYLTARDGHLYELLTSDGKTWQRADLSALVQPLLGTSATLTSAPSAYTFGDSSKSSASAPERMVFAIGSDGHLYSFVWTSLGNGVWSAEDVSADAVDGPRLGTDVGLGLVGAPSAYFVPRPGVHDVYAVGSDGHLYQYTLLDGWHAQDISALGAQPVGVALAASPVAFTFALNGEQAARHGVFAATSIGHLVELSSAPQSAPAWAFADHGAPTGTTLGGGALSGGAWQR